MKLTAENVKTTLLSCLFKKEEDTENMIVADGAVLRIGFHPERLKKATPNIEAMLDQLPLEFSTGSSFLNMCITKDDEHWGEHKNVDELVCLGLAIGKLHYVMPRESWSILPGGMPYLVKD